jgi:hypothetical protein
MERDAFRAAAGEYELDLQLLGATGKLGLDGKIIAQMGWWGGHGDIVFANRDNVIPTTDGLDNLRRPVKLSAGAHAITVEAKADGSGDPVQVRLAWVTPEMKARAFADAIEAARTSKFAVVFAWSRNRPFFGLPGDQDRLIAEGRGGQQEHDCRAQHRASRSRCPGSRTCVPFSRCGTRAMRRLGSRQPPHRQGESRGPLAHHLAAAASRMGRRTIRPILSDPRSASTGARGTPRAFMSVIAGSTASGSNPCFRSASASRIRASNIPACRCGARRTGGWT